MKTTSFIPLSLLALAPLLSFAAEGHVHKADGSCCGDVSKFVDKPASGHVHAAGENPRVTLKAGQVANLALKTEKIAPAKIARTAFALGDIDADPRGESAAASRIAGRVVSLKVALGDSVKAGDTLAVIESRQPGGEPAKIAITALAAGTVTEVLTRLGEPVSPDTPLLRLADHTRLVAEARIPQRYAAELKPGATRARLTPEGGETREVVLDSLAPKADPVTGTVTARFLIDNRDRALTPGRRAEFRVILSEKEFPVTVPRDAIQGEKGDLFVFVEETPGVYEKHPVLVGEGDERTVAVTGPEAGEKVVVHGAYSLRYADASNVSLREAMDAAHGHKHGPNGEEPEGEGHDHDHATGSAGGSPAPAHDHAPGTHTHADGTVHNADHSPVTPEKKPAAGTHTHADGTVHNADHSPVTPEAKPHDEAGHKHAEGEADHDAPAKKPVVGKSALQAAQDAAHGHSHGPNGEEPDEHTASANPGFFSGDSGSVFFATLAAGEAILLALALTALRRKQSKESADA